jgi:hypothetical protein
MPRINVSFHGQSYTMVSPKPRPPNRRPLFIPILMLPMVMFSSYFLIRPPSFAQLDKNTSSVDIEDEDESRGKGIVSRQPKLKGSKEKADRLPSWLREKAISKLSFTNKNNITNIDHQDINMWSMKQKRSNSTNAIIDVIIVGSISRADYMNAQQWTTRKQSVRNVFKATEKNTYRSLGSGRCQALVSSCASSIRRQHMNNQHRRIVQYSNSSLTPSTTSTISKVNDAEICLQRRFGLAMGASVRRYRKIKHALTLVSSSIRQPTNGPLPDYLIITFDNAYYNTNMLKECMTDDARIGNSPVVFAPLVSYTDVSLNTQMIHQYMKQHNHSVTTATFDVFPYPTNRSGVVFNNEALQLWMKEVRCYVAKNNNSSTSSFVPLPVTYDRLTQALEYQLCRIVKQRVPTKKTNIFESALIKTLQLSLSIQSKRNQTSSSQNEFVYSKILEAKSISDLFTIYASHKQLLCKVMQIDHIPSEEELLGYLIHRFKLSNDGLSLSSSEADNKSTCKVASSDNDCDVNRTLACTNLSLQKVNNTI